MWFPKPIRALLSERGRNPKKAGAREGGSSQPCHAPPAAANWESPPAGRSSCAPGRESSRPRGAPAPPLTRPSLARGRGPNPEDLSREQKPLAFHLCFLSTSAGTGREWLAAGLEETSLDYHFPLTARAFPLRT